MYHREYIDLCKGKPWILHYISVPALGQKDQNVRWLRKATVSNQNRINVLKRWDKQTNGQIDRYFTLIA